jgi:hypothetical protein
MLELLRSFLSTLARLFRKRHDFLVENLVRRHQVTLRFRWRTRLETRDRVFWPLVGTTHRD